MYASLHGTSLPDAPALARFSASFCPSNSGADSATMTLRWERRHFESECCGFENERWSHRELPGSAISHTSKSRFFLDSFGSPAGTWQNGIGGVSRCKANQTSKTSTPHRTYEAETNYVYHQRWHRAFATHSIPTPVHGATTSTAKIRNVSISKMIENI